MLSLKFYLKNEFKFLINDIEVDFKCRNDEAKFIL